MAGSGHIPLALEDGLAEVATWPDVADYVRSLSCREECDVVLIEPASAGLAQVPSPEWSLAGIDVGYFESEWAHFSVILHEVLFGIHDTMRAFADRLNEHLLLPSLDDAARLIAEHERLVAAGEDVETAGPPMAPIAVYVRTAE